MESISHVIPDERPVRSRSQVGGLTTAYRRGPEVCFGEVIWTCCRQVVEVAMNRIHYVRVGIATHNLHETLVKAHPVLGCIYLFIRRVRPECCLPLQ